MSAVPWTPVTTKRSHLAAIQLFNLRVCATPGAATTTTTTSPHAWNLGSDLARLLDTAAGDFCYCCATRVARRIYSSWTGQGDLCGRDIVTFLPSC